MTAEAILRSIARLEKSGAGSSTVEKWQRLVKHLQAFPPALVAFSGGVDSSFLSNAVFLVQESRMLAVTVDTGLDSPGQIRLAVDIAAEIGFPHRVLKFNAFNISEIVANPTDRCYFCKRSILSCLWDYARQNGYGVVLEGQNLDDETDYRPGRRAVRETETRSPLAECGLTKADIRELARLLDLRVWDHPASPCLATRFPYGIPLSVDGLEKVAAGEDFLRKLGFGHSRVRYYRDMIRIEVMPDQIDRLVAEREQVAAFFKASGFSHVAVDLQGYRQGSMNEGLER